ncbi:MAG TPA: glycosyltransferase [Pontiellaceae bacterium]|nr:glycosyltransferase [Pontiellaceae bacterium]HPR83298.1 glycosyltransferase [Pontiellaceae bacterium]
MKILFLTNKLPHAEVAGGHRLIYQRIRYLSERGHRIGLLTFVQGETAAQIESLKPLLTELHTLPHPRRNIFIRALHDYLSLSRPAVFWKSYSRDMMKEVGQVAEQGKYDLVIAEFSEMGQYLHKNPYLSAIHKVISCHRCVTASYEKYKSLGEVRLKLYLKSIPQLRGLQKYEFNMYRSADRILVLTPQDRFTMQYYAQDLAISVAPAGVDIRYLQEHPPVPKEPIVLITGFMSDPANEDSVEWFYHHVWPRLSERHPEVKFYIVGAGVRPSIKRLAEKDCRIIVTGEVEDMRPYRNRARVFVSPVRLGSGMRTKVLEAMAGGVPVVSTSLGMAGIDAQTGVNCLVADTPELFTQSVEWLLTDRALAARMVRNARELVAKKHSLESGMRRFENIITSIAEG